MRISELSDRSGRSVATIKYYVREGLLPPGRRTSATQAEYGEEHVHRLRLITALLEIGRLPIATVRDVLSAVDDPALSLHEALGAAHHALALRTASGDPCAGVEDAAADVDRFLARRGLEVSAGAPGRRELAGALATLRGLGWDVDADVFGRYATVADRLAAEELDRTPTGGSRAQAVEAVVVGTVVFEAALVALRRLAQEHHSSRRHR